MEQVKRGDKFAILITAMMATWTFIFVFLGLCLIEIWFNHTPWVVYHRWNFDPQTIILNLFLSLVAAIQGSIIMIAQKQHDAKMDRIIEHIEKMEIEHGKREKRLIQFVENYLKGAENKNAV